MDRAYVNEVEAGKPSLSVYRLLRICQALGVNASKILKKVEEKLSK